MPIAPLPKTTRDVASRVLDSERHPGLQLDKFAETVFPDGKVNNNEPGLKDLEKVVQAKAASNIYNGLRAKWQKMLDALCGDGGATFKCRTVGPMTIHLSRATTILENTGICLHPVYGFVYLPGSGLKGMARAYAETVWLKARENKPDAWRKIEDVFGWTSGVEKYVKDHNYGFKPEKRDAVASAGSVVFHDAWALDYPQLEVDILNPHHSEYYRGNGDRHPPGDWENPVPVFFLRVKAGTRFLFGISPRSPRAKNAGLIELAKGWLLGALVHLGVGAKTAAGYGGFKVEREDQAIADSHWNEALNKKILYSATHTVELVSPAFVGNATHDLDEIPLRPATIKGLLRKWWRAFHPEMGIEELRKREKTIFGSTDSGQGLVLRVKKYEGVITLRKGQDMDKGGSPEGYLGYGPIGYESERHRNVTNKPAIKENASFNITLTHRDEESLREAERALWVFCALGGVGSRSNRGWGSLRLKTQVDNLPQLKNTSTTSDYKTTLEDGLETLCPAGKRPPAQNLGWTALSEDMRLIGFPKTFRNYRDAIRDIGNRFQRFRHRYGQNKKQRLPDEGPGPDYELSKRAIKGQNINRPPERAGFGLPYAQTYRSLKKTIEYIPYLDDKKLRRASPVIIRIIKVGARYSWLTAFLPAKFLPKGATIKGKVKNGNEACNYTDFNEFGIPPAGEYSNVPDGSTLVLKFLDKLADECERNKATPEEQSSVPPPQDPWELEVLEGEIIEKPNTRKATVKMDNGETLENVSGAKRFSLGDRVKVEKLPGGDFKIEGNA